MLHLPIRSRKAEQPQHDHKRYIYSGPPIHCLPPTRFISPGRHRPLQLGAVIRTGAGIAELVTMHI